MFLVWGEGLLIFHLNGVPYVPGLGGGALCSWSKERGPVFLAWGGRAMLLVQGTETYVLGLGGGTFCSSLVGAPYVPGLGGEPCVLGHKSHSNLE